MAKRTNVEFLSLNRTFNLRELLLVDGLLHKCLIYSFCMRQPRRKKTVKSLELETRPKGSAAAQSSIHLERKPEEQTTVYADDDR